MHSSPHAVPDSGQREDLCVSRVPLFRGLTYDEQVEIAGVARPTHLDRGEQMYSAGSEVQQLMVMHKGRVKISRISAGGHEQIIRVLEPGDFLGESAFLTGARTDHTATALEDAQMCVFRHEDLGDFIEKHASIGIRMLQTVSRRLGEAEARLSAVISSDVSSRLADYLLSLPAKKGSGSSPLVVLPLSKKDIASMLDTTPESLSRQLRYLSDAGMISQGSAGHITLVDVDGLSNLTDQN